MSGYNSQPDYAKSLPERLENSPYDLTRGQKIWFGCWLAIAFASFVVGIPVLAIVAFVAFCFGWRTHEGVLYERIVQFPVNRRISKGKRAFYDPHPVDAPLGLSKTRESKKSRESKLPFKIKPIGLVVPYFGDMPRGILYDPSQNVDTFIIAARGWTAANKDLKDRWADENDLSEALKEALSELDGGIGIVFLGGTRPHNVYPHSHARRNALRGEIYEAIKTNEADNQVTADEANYEEELLEWEKHNCVDRLMAFAISVPRPVQWSQAIEKRGYLTEGEISRSTLARVMEAALEGFEQVGIQGAHVLDMPEMFSHNRSSWDVGGIDKFHESLHFASLQLSEGKALWETLFKDQAMWPRRIWAGKNYVMTDQTAHRVLRIYRFKLTRVLPGFMDSLSLMKRTDWHFRYAFVGRTVSATSESSWLTRRIVMGEGVRRVFRSGDRYETLEEQTDRELPRNRQDELYVSRGPAVRYNYFVVISVPVPPLSDSVDKSEQRELALHALKTAENEFRKRARRMRIVSFTVRGGYRHLNALVTALTGSAGAKK